MDVICRVCLGSGSEQLTSIFDMQDSLPIFEKIMSVATITIAPNDNLPTLICMPCTFRVKDSYKLKVDCEKSDKKLREYWLNTLQESYIKHEIIHDGSKEVDDQTNNFEIKIKIESQEFKSGYKKKGKSRVKKETNTQMENKYSNDNQAEENVHQNSDRLCIQEVPKKKRHKKPPQKQQCVTCGKVVSSKFRLKMHIRTHTGEKPFACEYCSKAFSLAHNLKIHERIHTGAKPLQCTTCGKAFAHNSGLNAHVRIHTGEKPYKCTVCPKSFRTHGHLSYHIRQHTGEKNFACHLCERAFIARGDLTNHIRTHTGEKSYVCSTCGMCLTRTSHLKRHMLTHTVIKPFKCPACPASFVKEDDLEKHSKRHKKTDIDKGQCTEKNGDLSQTLQENCSQKVKKECRKEEKSFRCNMCPKVYATQDGFMRHAKKTSHFLVIDKLLLDTEKFTQKQWKEVEQCVNNGFSEQIFLEPTADS